MLSVGHAQAWSLISGYEAENMCLARAWVSAGRCTRMVQMMNFHRLDGETEIPKQMIPPPRDWLELEERRRTFWAAFCSDRYSCAGSGWPMAIDERDVNGTYLLFGSRFTDDGRSSPTYLLRTKHSRRERWRSQPLSRKP